MQPAPLNPYLSPEAIRGRWICLCRTKRLLPLLSSGRRGGQSDALKYETGQQKAAFLGRLLEYDLPTNYVSQQSEILKNLKREDLQASAQKYLPIDNMYIVVVGDRAKAFPGLSELGYEVVELDLNGNKVATLTAPAAAAPAAPAAAPATAEKMKVVKKDKEGKKKRKQKTNEDGTAGKGE